MFKKLSFIILIILISGVSGIVADKYIFPRLALTKFFSKYDFFRKSMENTTIINKTEEVYVKEDSSTNKITNQIVSSVVNIVSYNQADKKNNFKNGTGLIATSDGIIITYVSAIIPDASSKYKVIANDGNVYDGSLLGIDSWSNLAFIKINASNLSVASFGNSDEYKAGEKLVVISNDMPEYQNRFSTGILNSFDFTFNISQEAFSVAEKLEGVFLTDFNQEAISAGSPVINYSGQVIGIMGSVMKNGTTQYFQIPSNKIKSILNKATDKSLELTPALGVHYISISKSYALVNNLTVNKGAIIYPKIGPKGTVISSETIASKAGIKTGDIITKIGEKEVNLSNNLSVLLYEHKKGDLIKVTVLRDGKEIEIPVQL